MKDPCSRDLQEGKSLTQPQRTVAETVHYSQASFSIIAPYIFIYREEKMTIKLEWRHQKFINNKQNQEKTKHGSNQNYTHSWCMAMKESKRI